MRTRWFFSFGGKGYKSFECDATQVIVNGDIPKAVKAGYCVVQRLDGSHRFINMGRVKFIDVYDYPDQIGEEEKDRAV